MALPLEDLIESDGQQTPEADPVQIAAPVGSPVERDPLADLLSRANLARDSRGWAEAAEGYRAVLELDPALAPIWVQYGHMLKETGRHDEAASAYARALELEPVNADTHLQMGHLFKITNKKLSAIESYTRALDIDPHLHEAEKELRALGADSFAEKILGQAARSRTNPQKPTLYFDISDLIFHHFPSNRSPTGIQRIVLAVAEGALDGGRSQDVGLCVLEGDTGKWKAVDNEAALHLMMLSHEGAANADQTWQSALGDVHRAIWKSPALRFPQNSTLVSLGAPWGIRRYFAALRAAKRESRIRCVGYIHDTVPLLYPEYCDGVIPQEFLRWLRRLSRHADLVLANSYSTKRDFQQALEMLGAANVPCEVVYPNGDFTTLFEQTGEISPEAAALLAAPYALFVGTVQPRKNHLMIVSAWRHLIRELGPEKVPNLVLAGKLGWYWEQLVEFLRKTEDVGGKVTMLNKASDADLQALYKGAMFTIYNSHYEGWGLPVTESLSFGKVPVVSRNSALLESGGKYALYYETNSEPSFVDAIKDILRDPQILRERETLIQNDPPVRSWGDVYRETSEVIRRTFSDGETANASSQPVLELGTIYDFGLLRDQASEAAFARGELMEDIMTDVSNWWDAEPWGIWTRSRKVELRFELPRADGAPAAGGYVLLLQLRGHRGEAQVVPELNGAAFESISVGAQAEAVLSISITPEALADHKVSLILNQSAMTDLDRLTGGEDRRSIGVGISALMVCDVNDLAARLSFLELTAGYNTVGALASSGGTRRTSSTGSDSLEEGGFLRLGGKRADIAHAPDELVRAAKVL